MIIIIDDDFEVRFGEVAPPGTLHAATPDEAIALIQAQWDSIAALFLDHDLGTDDGGQTINTRPVVKWLETKAYAEGKAAQFLVLVHSMNTEVGPLVLGLQNRGYDAHRVNLNIAQKMLKELALPVTS